MKRNYLIIEELRKSEQKVYTNAYRGVARNGSFFPGEIYESHKEFMDLYNEFLILTEHIVYVHDLQFLRKLLNFYINTYPNQLFEIIEVSFEDLEEKPSHFIGYDIIWQDSSNILGLTLFFMQKKASDYNDDFSRLLVVASHFFYQYLNEFKLFSDLKIAELAASLYNELLKYHKPEKRFKEYKVSRVLLIDENK